MMPSKQSTSFVSGLAGLVVLAFTLDLIGIGWGLPHPTGDWATDGLAPLAPLAVVGHLVHGERWWGKYPPFHFVLLALVQAPYMTWLWLHGEVARINAQYPYGFAHPLVALGRLALLGRLVSVVMGVGAVVFTTLTATELFGRRAGVLAGLVLLSSPVTVYYAHTTNLDVPYLFWTTAALWLAVRVARGARGLGTHVLLGVLAALAVATKDQAYACFALLPLPLLWRRWREGTPLDASLAAALAAFVAVYAVASLLLIAPAGYLAHARQVLAPQAVPYFYFPVTVSRVLHLALRTLSATASALGAPLALASAAGLVLAAARRTPGAEMPLVMAASYCLMFLVPMLFVVARFVLPLVAMLAPFGGLALAVLWGEPGSRLTRVRRTVAGIAVATAVAYGASMDVRLLTDARYGAEQWIAAHASSGVIGTDADPSYLPRLAPTRRVVRVELSPGGLRYPGPEPPELIVLSSARYREYFLATRRAERHTLAALMRGELCYAPVADFRSPALFGPPLVRAVSPRIVVLRRREPCGVEGAPGGPLVPPPDGREAKTERG